jgi:hypothetical protein
MPPRKSAHLRWPDLQIASSGGNLSGGTICQHLVQTLRFRSLVRF